MKGLCRAGLNFPVEGRLKWVSHLHLDQDHDQRNDLDEHHYDDGFDDDIGDNDGDDGDADDDCDDNEGWLDHDDDHLSSFVFVYLNVFIFVYLCALSLRICAFLSLCICAFCLLYLCIFTFVYLCDDSISRERSEVEQWFQPLFRSLSSAPPSTYQAPHQTHPSQHHHDDDDDEDGDGDDDEI